MTSAEIISKSDFLSQVSDYSLPIHTPWIQSICIAKFDHNYGIILEQVLPANSLSEQEIQSVAMLSFPESNCAENEWEHTFFYRFRKTNVKKTEISQIETSEFLFGFAYYIQKKDISNPRGYLQKSFIIVTPFYFTSFYLRLVQLMGQAYFSYPTPTFLKVFFVG